MVSTWEERLAEQRKRRFDHFEPIELSLDTARTNERFPTSGDGLHVVELSAGASIDVRLNHPNNPPITISRASQIDQIAAVFTDIYITHTAQAGESVKLLAGIDFDLKKKLNSGQVVLSVAANNSSSLDKSRADFVCDGAADEAEINAAIDLLEVGGTVELAAGTYNIAGAIVLDDNTRLVGSGWSTILDVADFDDSAIEAVNKSQVAVKSMKLDVTARTPDEASPQNVYFNECSQVIAQELWIVGYGDGTNEKGSGDGITAKTCNNVLISNIQVEGCYHNIMISFAGSDIVISDIISKTPGVEHVLCEWTDEVGGTHDGNRGERVTINNVVGYDAGQHGLFVTDYNDVTITNCSIINMVGDGLKMGWCDKVQVSNCIFSNSSTNRSLLLLSEANDIGISNCQFRGADQEVIEITGSNVLLNNCYVSGGNNADVIALDGASNITFSGCQITDSSFNTGIHINNGATNIRFIGCRILDVGNWYTFRVDDCQELNVANCELLNSDNQAVIFDINAGGQIIISGNIMESVGGSKPFDIENGVSEIVIANNVFIDADESEIDGQQITVSGNIWNSTHGTPNYIINFEANSENAVCLGNVALSSLFATGDFRTAAGTDINDDDSNVN